MGRMEEHSGKEAMRLLSEKEACPRKGNPTAVKTKLSRGQTERGGKVFWDTEESDRHPTGCGNSCVASKPLCPREARVGALGAGKDQFCFGRRSCGERRQAHLDGLESEGLHKGTTMLYPDPSPPQQRSGAHLERNGQA